MDKERKYSGRYCVAYGCQNNNKKIPDLSLFKLPRDPDRRKEWLTAIGREDLLNIENLKHNSYEVCCAHFEDSYIRSMKQLRPDAVPTSTPFVVQSTSNVRKLPSVKTRTISVQTETNTFFEATSQTTETSIKVEAKRTLSTSDSECKRRRIHDCVIVNEELVEEVDPLACEDEVFNVPAATCIEAPAADTNPDDIQNRIQKLIDWRNNRNLHEPDNKAFALSLLSSSPNTYKCFQSTLNLPSKTALRKFKMNIPAKPDDCFLEGVASRLKTISPTARYCCVCVNQMDLRRNVCYDARSDEMFGCEDIACALSPEIATSVYIVMLQSMYVNWHQPLGYTFLSNKKHYHGLDLWLNEVINKLFQKGIEVKALVTDQEENFDFFAKDVRTITIDRPYFFVGGHKVYYIFDVPNLLKSVRNHWLSNDFYLDDNVINYDYIKKLYADQTDKVVQSIPKLTDAHISPNKFQKKRVKYAAQIFSNSVAATLEMYIEFKKLPKEARHTAEFVKSMDDLFDILNIRKTARSRTAFTMSEYQMAIFDEAQSMFGKMNSFNRTTGEYNSSKFKASTNFQITIQSIIQLFEELKEDGVHYLFTRRLNQDCLENFLRDVKRESGCRGKPSAFQFKRAFSKLFVSHLINSSTNSELDLSEMVRKAEKVVETFEMTHPREKAESRLSQVQLPGENDFRIELPVVNASIYVAGYLIFKCSQKHDCEQIKEKMKELPSLSQSALYAHYKAFNKHAVFYGKLKIAPQDMIQYIERLESTFTENFEFYLLNNPGSSIYKVLKKVLPFKHCPCFPLDYLIKLFVRLRIYALVKFNNRCFKSGKKFNVQYFKVKELSAI